MSERSALLSSLETRFSKETPSVCPVVLVRLWFLSPDPVTVRQRGLGSSALSEVGGDPVPDVVLQALPRAVPQRFRFGVQTTNAVVLLGDLMAFDETHHLSFNSLNLLLSPFIFTTALKHWGGDKRGE